MTLTAPNGFGQLTFATISPHSCEFAEILRLREMAYQNDAAGRMDEEDAYSEHFICRYQDKLVGALRSTFRERGSIESEAHYPAWILNRFSRQLTSSSRLCVSLDFKGANRIPLPLIRFAWQYSLRQGIRLDVSKVRIEAVPFYLRLGYYLVNDSFFEFDRWESTCAIVAYPANAKRKTQISDVFQDVKDGIDFDRAEFNDKLSACYRSFRKTVKQFKFGRSAGQTVSGSPSHSTQSKEVVK